MRRVRVQGMISIKNSKNTWQFIMWSIQGCVRLLRTKGHYVRIAVAMGQRGYNRQPELQTALVSLWATALVPHNRRYSPGRRRSNVAWWLQPTELWQLDVACETLWDQLPSTCCKKRIDIDITTSGEASSVVWKNSCNSTVTWNQFMRKRIHFNICISNTWRNRA